jgi:hypothetical protein
MRKDGGVARTVAILYAHMWTLTHGEALYCGVLVSASRFVSGVESGDGSDVAVV